MNSIPETQEWCAALYEARASALILYGRAMNLSHGEAEDVVQELFVTLLKRNEPPQQPEFYLLRAFRNRALNYRRSWLRRLLRERDSLEWFEGTSQPSDLDFDKESAAIRCLTHLPREQREVIVLKIWHQRTFEEIGELLDLSPNTAAGRYRYGLEKIRVCFRNTSYEEQHTKIPGRSGFHGDASQLLDTSSALSTSAGTDFS